MDLQMAVIGNRAQPLLARGENQFERFTFDEQPPVLGGNRRGRLLLTDVAFIGSASKDTKQGDRK
jgi:hypothetical protein